MSHRKKPVRKTKTIQPTVEIAGVKLFTVQAIADAFNVNKITILRHIKEKRLVARLIGHKYYVTAENLRIFLDSPMRIKEKEKTINTNK